MSFWDRHYSTDVYIYGREPSSFLSAHEALFRPGQRVLAVADGEGRNGVYLARLGLDVHSVDGSAIAVEKANKLASESGVAIRAEQADLLTWEWPEAEYDHVVAIFIQFVGPDLRSRLFAGMKRVLKPGGYLLLHGYRPEQIANGTGGPGDPACMYTEELLRQEFADLEILELVSEDKIVHEGIGHSGQSALISLVARKPIS